MGKMKDLIADEWDRAYRQGYDDALAEHLGCLSQILDSPAPSAVQTEQQTSELQGKWDAVIAALQAMPTIAERIGSDALEQEYANGKSHGLLEGWSSGIEEGYSTGLNAAIAAIQAMPTIEDQMEYAYLDLTVPEILAILKDILKDTQ